MPYFRSIFLAILGLVVLNAGPALGSGRMVAAEDPEMLFASAVPFVTFINEEGDDVVILPAGERPPRFRHLDVIVTLESSGYTILSVRETLLNRIRIQARNELHLREIVISRSSGNILRDVALENYGAQGGVRR